MIVATTAALGHAFLGNQAGSLARANATGGKEKVPRSRARTAGGCRANRCCSIEKALIFQYNQDIGGVLGIEAARGRVACHAL